MTSWPHGRPPPARSQLPPPPLPPLNPHAPPKFAGAPPHCTGQVPCRRGRGASGGGGGRPAETLLFLALPALVLSEGEGGGSVPVPFCVCRGGARPPPLVHHPHPPARARDAAHRPLAAPPRRPPLALGQFPEWLYLSAPSSARAGTAGRRRLQADPPPRWPPPRHCDRGVDARVPPATRPHLNGNTITEPLPPVPGPTHSATEPLPPLSPLSPSPAAHAPTPRFPPNTWLFL